MRDEKDPGTIEMPIPGRRGRPPANGLAAMSDADRARAYRERRKELKAKLDRKRGGWRDAPDSILLDMIRDAMSSPEGRARDRLIGIYAAELASRYPKT